jgi:CheY-like chemotaxis protein
MENRKIIVYVDDDWDDLLLLQEAFKESVNYDLVCLKNEDELLLFLKERIADISLIILDVNIPKINGIDILLKLKASPLYKFLPVVMLSTGAQPEEKRIVESMGCRLILKPSSYQDNITLVTRLLDNT